MLISSDCRAVQLESLAACDHYSNFYYKVKLFKNTT